MKISPIHLSPGIALKDNKTVADILLETGLISGCAKSQRAAVLVNPARNSDYFQHEYYWATNSPPPGFHCLADTWCFTNCGKVAVHAEERVILKAHTDISGWEIFHAKVSKERHSIVASGPPSCVKCSRLILDANIGGVWLFHGESWRRYGAWEFHRLTLDYCFPKEDK